MPIEVDIATAPNEGGSTLSTSLPDLGGALALSDDTPAQLDGTPTAGGSKSAARSDHKHALANATVSSPGAMSAADKARLDSLVGSVTAKAASTSALSRSGTQTIDGVACGVGDVVFQATPAGDPSDGLWVVASGSWTRTSDVIAPGLSVFVQLGTVLRGSWVLITPGPSIIVDSTPLRFVRPRIEAHPEDFGAVGDGVTDDHDAIISAILSLNGQAGIVRFSQKNYRSSLIDLNGYYGVIFRGAGRSQTPLGDFIGTTLKAYDSSQHSLIWSRARHVFVEDMNLDGNGTCDQGVLFFDYQTSTAKVRNVNIGGIKMPPGRVITWDHTTNTGTTVGAHGLNVSDKVYVRTTLSLPDAWKLNRIYRVLTVPTSTTLTLEDPDQPGVTFAIGTDNGSGTQYIFLHLEGAAGIVCGGASNQQIENLIVEHVDIIGDFHHDPNTDASLPILAHGVYVLGFNAFQITFNQCRFFFSIDGAALSGGGAFFRDCEVFPVSAYSRNSFTWLDQPSQPTVIDGYYSETDAAPMIGHYNLIKPVLGATNATPIVMHVAAHGLYTGLLVSQKGILGNTAANGKFSVTVIDADHYSLQDPTGTAPYTDVAGNGAYTSGGTMVGEFGTPVYVQNVQCNQGRAAINWPNHQPLIIGANSLGGLVTQTRDGSQPVIVNDSVFCDLGGPSFHGFSGDLTGLLRRNVFHQNTGKMRDLSDGFDYHGAWSIGASGSETSGAVGNAETPITITGVHIDLVAGDGSSTSGSHNRVAAHGNELSLRGDATSANGDFGLATLPPQGYLTANAALNSGVTAFVTTRAGFGGFINYDASTGIWTVHGTSGSLGSGADITATNQTLFTIHPDGQVSALGKLSVPSINIGSGNISLTLVAVGQIAVSSVTITAGAVDVQLKAATGALAGITVSSILIAIAQADPGTDVTLDQIRYVSSGGDKVEFRHRGNAASNTTLNAITYNVYRYEWA
ncbi:MAG TPA: hypothetical protein VGQ38_15390 [Gaiellaceae bacterium]|jgi:hypothetical protein|nr:hypothetical protein [Gaiellaceae bacterium]